MTAEEEIGELMTAMRLSLATAESCTGGLVAHRITNVSGSSAYFLGGLVSYSNEAKEALLGVRHQTLVAHGAVSEETAREMARGTRQRLAADLAVSITGIAGPTGATAGKPVGLTYIALAAPDAEVCRRFEWQGSRLDNKESSAEAALDMILKYLRERRRHVVEFIDELISVEVHTRNDGQTRPLGFAWGGRHYKVESWGRHGVETRDGRSLHCYLVQTEDGATWELCQDTETAQWSLMRHWAVRHRAV